MEHRYVTTVENNPSLQGLAQVIPDVVFSTPEPGLSLTMQLIVPWEVTSGQSSANDCFCTGQRLATSQCLL